MTVMGLQRLLYILDKKADDDLYRIVEATLTRYMSGDRSMIIEVDLDSPVSFFKPHTDILRIHYNFEPHTTCHS